MYEPGRRSGWEGERERERDMKAGGGEEEKYELRA